MKRFQNLLGMFLVVVASAGLFVACGDDDTSCLSDDDCGTGELCNFETEECAFDCSDDPDICATGETCADRTEETGSICVEDDTNNDPNNEPECEISDDCEGEQVCEDNACVDPCEVGDCAEGFACNTDTGICEEETGPSGDFRFIRVLDDSAGADACEPSDNDPGSDLYGIELITDDGNFWAEVENADGIVTDSNDFADADTILDGNPPGLDGDCPEGTFSDSVVALGCGGDVIVEFRDANDDPVFFSAGDQVVVYEFGATCGGSDVDEYLTEVCTTTSEDDIFDGTCNGTDLGGGSGVVQVEVVE